MYMVIFLPQGSIVYFLKGFLIEKIGTVGSNYSLCCRRTQVILSHYQDLPNQAPNGILQNKRTHRRIPDGGHFDA